MSNELNSDDAACIGSDMSLTITERNLVKRIAQLEADNAELVCCIERLKNHINKQYPFTEMQKAQSLIQKHAAK